MVCKGKKEKEALKGNAELEKVNKELEQYGF